MSEKTRIVAALGERRLLLPALLNEALAANDRAKYRFTLLQTAKAHADSPDEAFSDLRTERLACGITDTSYDDVVAGTARRGADTYRCRTCTSCARRSEDDLVAMIAPFETAQKPEANLFQQRLLELSGTSWYGEDEHHHGCCHLVADIGSPCPGRQPPSAHHGYAQGAEQAAGRDRHRKG